MQITFYIGFHNKDVSKQEEVVFRDIEMPLKEAYALFRVCKHGFKWLRRKEKIWQEDMLKLRRYRFKQGSQEEVKG